VQKISPSPGFDRRTVQPVASHFTDCAIPAPIIRYINFFFNFNQKHFVICDWFRVLKKSERILFHMNRRRQFLVAFLKRKRSRRLDRRNPGLTAAWLQQYVSAFCVAITFRQNCKLVRWIERNSSPGCLFRACLSSYYPETDAKLCTINGSKTLTLVTLFFLKWPRNKSLCALQNTGMRRITTFRSTTDRMYDSGPIRLWYFNTILCYNTYHCVTVA
jgi:hypothetical protein